MVDANHLLNVGKHHDQGSYTSPISVVDANHLLNVGKHHDQGSYASIISVVDANHLLNVGKHHDQGSYFKLIYSCLNLRLLDIRLFPDTNCLVVVKRESLKKIFFMFLCIFYVECKLLLTLPFGWNSRLLAHITAKLILGS